MSRQDQQGDRFLRTPSTTDNDDTNLPGEAQAQVPATAGLSTSTSQSHSHRPSITSEGVTMDGLYAAVNGRERRRHSALDDDSDVWDVPSDVPSPR
ncbi:hypothetical protein BDW68DRAFT_13924 [Aspergillus falconensis]